MKYPKLLALLWSVIFLAACGGGGGGTDNPPPTPTVNTAPIANAGADQSVLVNTVVTLDGSKSSDANNDPLTYAWTLTTKPAGSAAALVNPTSAKPTFTADTAGAYVATLVVNDGKLDSAPDTVNISVSVDNAAPVANAGPAQNVAVGSVVTLDGSASSDANSDPLTYAWTLTTKPVGSAASLSAASSAKPTFTADVAGTYAASLVVNDGKVNSSNAATVSITAAVANVAPVANAGVAQNVAVGASVTLDGSASSDANGDALTYAWTLTSKPVGSAATLLSATSAKPTFTADVAGTFVASLIVNDGKVNSSAMTVSITAAVASASLKEEIRLAALSSNSLITQAIDSIAWTINNLVVTGNCNLSASIKATVNIAGQPHYMQTSGQAILYSIGTAVDCNYLLNSNSIIVSTAQIQGTGSINGPQLASNFQGQFDISGSDGYLVSANLSSGIYISDFFIVNGTGNITNTSYAGHQYPSITGSVRNVTIDIAQALNLLDRMQSGTGTSLGDLARTVKSGNINAQSTNCNDISIRFNGTNQVDIDSSCTSPNHFMVNLDTAAIIE